MMECISAPTHVRRKLVKTYKTVLPQKQTVVAEVSKGDRSQKKKNVMKIE